MNSKKTRLSQFFLPQLSFVATFGALTPYWCYHYLDIRDRYQLIGLVNIVLSSFLITIVLISLKTCLKCCDCISGKRILDRSIRDLKILCGVSIFIGIAPILILGYYGTSWSALLYSLFVPIYAIFLISALFIQRHFLYGITIKSTSNFKHIYYVPIIVHLVILLIIGSLNFAYRSEGNTIGSMLYYTLFAGAVIIPNTMALFILCSDGVELDDWIIQNESKKLLSKSAELECEICIRDYDHYYLIPRILPNCAHTICENCIDRMLVLQHPLLCPFCRKPNYINDLSAKNLRKNKHVLKKIKKVKLQADPTIEPVKPEKPQNIELTNMQLV